MPPLSGWGSSAGAGSGTTSNAASEAKPAAASLLGVLRPSTSAVAGAASNVEGKPAGPNGSSAAAVAKPAWPLNATSLLEVLRLSASAGRVAVDASNGEAKSARAKGSSAAALDKLASPSSATSLLTVLRPSVSTMGVPGPNVDANSAGAKVASAASVVKSGSGRRASSPRPSAGGGVTCHALRKGSGDDESGKASSITAARLRGCADCSKRTAAPGVPTEAAEAHGPPTIAPKPAKFAQRDPGQSASGSMRHLSRPATSASVPALSSPSAPPASDAEPHPLLPFAEQSACTPASASAGTTPVRPSSGIALDDHSEVTSRPHVPQDTLRAESSASATSGSSSELLPAGARREEDGMAGGTLAPPIRHFFRCRLPYGMTEAYKFSNAMQARARESNLEFYSQRSRLSRFHNVPIAAHARSPPLAQRAAARSCRPLVRIAH
eukprot:scaffold4484_cov98-Isochrysis_galbana.AAC.3